MLLKYQSHVGPSSAVQSEGCWSFKNTPRYSHHSHISLTNLPYIIRKISSWDSGIHKKWHREQRFSTSKTNIRKLRTYKLDALRKQRSHLSASLVSRSRPWQGFPDLDEAKEPPPQIIIQWHSPSWNESWKNINQVGISFRSESVTNSSISAGGGIYVIFIHRWELVLLFKAHCSPYTCPTSFGSLSMPTYPPSPMSCSPSNTAWNQAAIPWSSHLGCCLYRDSTRNAMLANVQVINWPTWEALKVGTKISSRKSPLPHETIGTTCTDTVIHKENEWQTHPQHPPQTKLQVTFGLNRCAWNVGICSYTS